jgi:hypothetical protein
VLSPRCNAVRNQSRSTMFGSSRKRIGILSFASVLSGFAFLTVGCDQLTGTSGNNRYELKQDNTGRTIRLDKQTGEIAILDGNKLTPVLSDTDRKVAEADRATEQALEHIRIEALGQPKTYPDQAFPLLGVKTASLFTIWRDGKTYCHLIFQPAPRQNGRSFGIGMSGFRVAFMDANGFIVAAEVIPTLDLVNNTDNDGHIRGMTANWSMDATRDIYDSVASWTLTWL